jgi:hypothetical protein
MFDGSICVVFSAPQTYNRVPERTVDMVLGMSLATFTLVHVVISLVGIVSGLLVLYGLIKGKRFDGATAIFLATTVLTSLTGFLFPFTHLLPSHIVGIISLVVLAVAILARYALHLVGSWRSIYVVSSVLALYLNVFVLVVQSFLKIPAVHALAPTQKEPPFLIVQLIVLAIFIVLGIFAVKGFRGAPAAAEAAWKSSKAS